MFDYLVFIGRFQPFHLGHKKVVDQALSQAKKVIILVGSANVAQSPRNPFTYWQRTEMIKRCYEGVYSSQWQVEDDTHRIILAPIYDNLYNDDAWVAHVQQTVDEIILTNSNPSRNVTIRGTNDIKVGLIGMQKDNTSFYLKLFPNWESVPVEAYGALSATKIRDCYFNDKAMVEECYTSQVPAGVAECLGAFKWGREYTRITEWYNYDRKYKDMWAGTPFPVQFNCADAVVIQSGHILLVTRKNHPGKGLLALPGGHLNNDESLMDCAIRELKEETRISDNRGEIPPAKLRGFITRSELFDDPHRSSRGRVLTQAYLFQLPNSKSLYKVRGDDDAEKAQWYELGKLRADQFFEDHAQIILRMTGTALIN